MRETIDLVFLWRTLQKVKTFYLIPICTYVLSSVKSVETPLGPSLFCLCLKVLIIRIENACSWSEWVIPASGYLHPAGFSPVHEIVLFLNTSSGQMSALVCKMWSVEK